jgi:hypothetical protein
VDLYRANDDLLPQQQQNVHAKTLYDDDSGITRDGITKQTWWLW